MRKAYLVGFIDTTVTPPKVCAAGIFSGSAATLTGGNRRFMFDIVWNEGDDYEEAKANLIQHTKDFPQRYGWLAAFLTDPPLI